MFKPNTEVVCVTTGSLPPPYGGCSCKNLTVGKTYYVSNTSNNKAQHIRIVNDDNKLQFYRLNRFVEKVA